jgi:hypothetical protein
MATKKQPSKLAREPTPEEDLGCSVIQHPVFSASFHLPKNSWHEHRDWEGSVEEPTEYQGFATMTMNMLMELSGGSNRLVLGYLGDMLNVLPRGLRLAMMHVLANGLGLDIKAATDELNTIEVNLVPRYEVLTPPPDQGNQLVTPGAAGQVTLPPELIEKIRRERGL